jgi:hypothetical protein
MKTKLTIIHNGFHGYTSASILVEGNPGDRIPLSFSQIKKLKRKACGIGDCKCGESLLAACEIPEPWNSESPVYLHIPDTTTEIQIRGNYPQA